MNTIKTIGLLAALAIVPFTAMAESGAPGPVRLVAEAQKEILRVENGATKREWVDIDRIVPGDTVVYIITAHNEGTDVVDGVVLDDPIPQDTAYVDGSAVAPNSVVEFSIDDGDSFAGPDDLRVVEADGTSRLATATDYTHIRFALNYPINPGDAARVHFKAVVK